MGKSSIQNTQNKLARVQNILWVLPDSRRAFSFRDDATEDQTLHPLLKGSHGKLQTSLIFANRPEEAISKHLDDRRRTEEFLQVVKFVNNKSQQPDLFLSLVCFSKIWFGPQAGLSFSHVGKHAQKPRWSQQLQSTSQIWEQDIKKEKDCTVHGEPRPQA